MIKRILQKIKTKKIGKKSIFGEDLPRKKIKKSRLRAFARTRAKNNQKILGYGNDRKYTEKKYLQIFADVF